MDTATSTPFDSLSGLALLFIWDNIKNANPLDLSGTGYQVQKLVQQALLRKIENEQLFIDKDYVGRIL